MQFVGFCRIRLVWGSTSARKCRDHVFYRRAFPSADLRWMHARFLVFEDCWSCVDLAGVVGFNSVFECDACDDFGGVVKAS
jgi:hypothetical protein